MALPASPYQHMLIPGEDHQGLRNQCYQIRGRFSPAMINQAGARFQTDRVFVGVLTIVAAGVILVEVVQRIERRVEIWRTPA